jgi:putative phosphoesterase
MIAIFSDTHSRRGHDLAGEALAAARDADTVLHAGDFTTEAALDGFRDVCDRLYAVHGNVDTDAVTAQLPTERVVEAAGIRIAMTHRTTSGPTGLELFGRARDATLVVSGHTHQPSVTATDDLVLLNPGSHADPRGNRPGFARLEEQGDRLVGRVREPDGTTIDTFEITVSGG